MPSVVVVGSVHVDLVARAARLPRRGETLLGTHFAAHPGGKGGNQAVQAALFGVASTFIGRVGRDAFGERLRNALRTKGVATDHLSEDPQAPTGSSMVITGEDGDYASVVVPGAAGRLDRGHLQAARHAFDVADVLLLQLEIDPATVATAISMGHAAGATVILNAAPAPAAPHLLPEAVWRDVDLLIVNQGEAEMLSGRAARDANDVVSAGRRLVSGLGVPTVVVTLGGDGVVLLEGDHAHRYPAWRVPVIDTIGAGDAFAGAVAASLASGADLEESVLVGNAAGALAVTKAGAYDAFPRREEVRRMIGSNNLQLGV